LDNLFAGNLSEVVVASKDRLARFGFDLIENIFNRFNARIVVVNSEQRKQFENELAEDVLSVITYFTAKYSGKRKYTKKLRKKDTINNEFIGNKRDNEEVEDIEETKETRDNRSKSNNNKRRTTITRNDKSKSDNESDEGSDDESDKDKESDENFNKNSVKASTSPIKRVRKENHKNTKENSRTIK
jgi:hypothetical protein